MHQIMIRAARFEDAISLARLMSQLGYPTSKPEMETRLENILLHPEYQAFIAQFSDRIVGVVGVCTGLSFESDGLCGRVIVLVVDEHQRGQGVGWALMQQAERWLIEQGARTAIINSGKQRLD